MDGLAGALGALLADPALAARLRRNARAAVSGYTWGAVASQIKELYAELWGAPLAAEAPEEAVVP